MKRTYPSQAIRGFGLLITVLASMGCRKSLTTMEPATTEATATQPADIDTVAETVEAGGARMWGQNCMRCHNLRPPRERSDREWDIIGHHMRVRANLTAREHRAIVTFLKAAN